MMKLLLIGVPFFLLAAFTLRANWQQNGLFQDQNNLGSIGIILDDSNEWLEIKGVLENGPAAAAGLHAGDTLWKINGTEAFYWDLSDAVEALRGEIGTDVSITVLRAGSSPLTVLLKYAGSY